MLSWILLDLKGILLTYVFCFIIDKQEKPMLIYFRGGYLISIGSFTVRWHGGTVVVCHPKG